VSDVLLVRASQTTTHAFSKLIAQAALAIVEAEA
jgi:hypothetical protein